MTVHQDPGHGRLLGLVAVAMLVVALLVLVARSDAPDPQGGGSRGQPTTAASIPTPSPSPRLPGAEILVSPEAAARHDAETLLAVANASAVEFGLTPTWRHVPELPLYVVNVMITSERRLVVADQLLAHRLDRSTDVLVLRFLPAAAALGTDPPFVSGAVDGQPATVTMDPDGALLRIDLGRERRAGEALTLRLSYRYSLADADTLGGDGPVGYGLLSRDDHVSVLAHWLPLLTHDTSPVQPTGDLGAFPAAIWSMEVVHPGVLVTGGREMPCRVQVDNCTQVVGAGLRDVAMLVLDDAMAVDGLVAGHRVRVTHLAGAASDDVGAVMRESVAAIEFYRSLFGALPWAETDVVGAPLSRGAAGMEFPGMFILRDDLWTSHGGGFGSYVIAHEAAHQWFHALVGNSSLSDAVVDEALAQYLSVVFFAEQYGQEAADALAADMRDRYDAAVATGLRADPPAQHLDAFTGDRAYGALVYGRAPLAFIEAEEAIGRERVVAFLREVVAVHGLREITAAELRDMAYDFDAHMGRIVDRWWFDNSPA